MTTKKDSDKISIILYIIGILTSSIGYVLALVKPNQLSLGINGIGIAIFLAAIAVNVYSINEKLKSTGNNIKEESKNIIRKVNNETEDIIRKVNKETEDIIREVNKETEDIIRELNNETEDIIRELNNERKHIIKEFQQEILRKILPSPHILLDCFSVEKPLVIRLVAKVMYHFTTNYVIEYLTELEKFKNPNRNNASIAFDHPRPAYDMLDETLKILSVGAVWCGITHINTKSAWKYSETSFEHFRAESRKKASNQEIFMLRVYIVALEENLEELKELFHTENHAKILTKYILTNNQNDFEKFPDISLVWQPRRNNKYAQNYQEIKSSEDLKKDPIKRIEDANYEPIVLLEFQTDNKSILSKVVISHPDNANFTTQVEKFKKAWSEGKFSGAEKS